jgi:DNA adenine methylase
VTPFLKWPGGKRWFVAKYASLLPAKYARFIEPFLGGGAVFFHLQPSRSLLGDLNAELVSAYRGIQSSWRKVETLLRQHQQRHSEAYYKRMRRQVPGTQAERAARLLYLNRTCFNGIYRVNKKGEFNVPRGTKTSVLLPSDDFRAIAALLARCDLRVADFQVLVDEARRGDFVFADPPYTVRHNHNAFIKYNEVLFSWEDQVRLADSLANARERGVTVVATNANHQSIRKLYRDRGFALQTAWRFSSISAMSESRKTFDELVITARTDGGVA